MHCRYIKYHIVITVLLGAGIINGCGSKQQGYLKNNTHTDVPAESIAKGEALAKQYCQSCHILPSPSLLDAATWENGVLPEMGPRLGIFEYQYRRYPNNVSDVHIGRGFYPAKPLMSPEEWQHIIDYYTATSPDTLIQPAPQPVGDASTFFKAVAPAISYATPATCFIKEDTLSKTFFISDILRKITYRYKNNLQLADSLMPGNIITDAIFNSSTIDFCNIGIFSPNNAKAGSIESMKAGGKEPSILVDTLERPVSLAEGDFNNDGRKDIVACEFGYLKGDIAWWEGRGNNKFKQHIIKAVPGAEKVFVDDYNNDGLMDIWVLFAQGDESISLFTNKGNGKFSEKQILRFPPCYGSSGFSLCDMNGDGKTDVIYTCGDNADFSTVFKPYHGVYIFLNDGRNNFTQKFFYHINGCYHAVAADFDGDGKKDIAAIAYFADFKTNPGEGFVLLHNEGDGNYKPYQLEETNIGRWISMDVADINNDGKPDILLANCSVGPFINKPAINWKKGPAFMLLKNISR